MTLPRFIAGNYDSYLGPAAKLVAQVRRGESSNLSPEFLALHFTGDSEQESISALVEGWISWLKLSEEVTDERLEQTIDAFNKCWSVETGERSLSECSPYEEIKETPYSRLRSLCSGNAPGFWITLDRLCSVTETTETAIEWEATIPLVLVNEKGGCAAQICVERLARGATGGVVYPDAFAVGLAFIGKDKENGWLAAFDRARIAAKQIHDNVRYRWSLRTVGEIEDAADPNGLYVHRYTGRSAEAAFVYAIWAASQLTCVDGVTLSNDPEMELDSRTTVSAQLDETQLWLGTATPLQPVNDLVNKLEAAEKVGIDFVIVATGQLEKTDSAGKTYKELIGDWNPKWLDQIVEVATLGEGYRKLTSSRHILKSNHAAVETAWLANWDPAEGMADEDGQPLSSGMWSEDPRWVRAAERKRKADEAKEARASADESDAEDSE